MKILHVITSLQIGGAEKLISEIVPMQRDLGNVVDVLAFDGVDTGFKKMLIKSGINVMNFGMYCNVYNPLFIFRLVKMMRRYDIVHTHNTSPQLFAAIGSYFTSAKLVTTEHSTSNRRRDNGKFKLVDRWMYSRYKHIICVSNMTKINLLDYLGKINTNVVTIENGIDINKYQNSKPLMDNEKSSMRFIITMVAAFRYQKDHETVIKALSHLDKSRFELWFVGDGERKSIIEDYISQMNLVDNVRFWGIRTDIPSILKSSDLVVQSSHIEGFGLAAVEGMAAGKPVVATNVPGLGQIVEGAGVLFTLGDDKKLASIIQRLADDKDYYCQIAYRCSEHARMFDIHKMVERYDEIYKSIINI